MKFKSPKAVSLKKYTHFLLIGVLVFLAQPNPLSCAGSGNDGVYGGSTGSSKELQRALESARQKAVLRDSLGKKSSPETHQGKGVELEIQFPPSQKGLGNITTVSLQPKDPGALPALTLARNSRGSNLIQASFSPKKGLLPGHHYEVLVEDSAGGKYSIGQIQVLDSRETQTIKVSAPMIGQSPTKPTEMKDLGAYKSGSSHQNIPSMETGAGYVRPSTGSGFVRPKQ